MSSFWKQLPLVIRLAGLRTKQTGIPHLVVFVKALDCYVIRFSEPLKPETIVWRA